MSGYSSETVPAEDQIPSDAPFLTFNEADRQAFLVARSRYGGDMADITREEVKLISDLSKTETDVKFAQLIGKIDASNSDIKGEIKAMSAHFVALERSTTGVKATIIATVAVGLGLAIGILGYGQQWFGIGMSTRDVVRQTVKEVLDQSALQQPSKQK
jgi:hypothetical protein